MNVKELQEQLSKLDDEAEVLLYTDCCGCTGQCTSTRVDESGIVWVEAVRP